MTTTTARLTMDNNSWHDATRIEAWAGEIRVNAIRLVALVIFYARHLIEFALAKPDAPVRGPYHLRVTLVVGAWACIAIVLHFRLRARRITPALKYAIVAFDLSMVTLLCMIAGGPKTPLVMLYFLVIATAPLRLSLRLVYLTTAGAMLGYLGLLAFYVW